MNKTFDILGTGKEKTKDIIKRSAKIAGAGIMIGIGAVGLGHGLSGMNGGYG